MNDPGFVLVKPELKYPRLVSSIYQAILICALVDNAIRCICKQSKVSFALRTKLALNLQDGYTGKGKNLK